MKKNNQFKEGNVKEKEWGRRREVIGKRVGDEEGTERQRELSSFMILFLSRWYKRKC